MKEYFLSLFLAAILIALVGILSPGKPSGGIGKHLRLLSSLFLLCVLLSPVTAAMDGIRDWLNSDGTLPDLGDTEENGYGELASNALDEASREYFSQMLAHTLSEEFSISPNDLRCRVEWELTEGNARPTRVTVLLSGSAVWRDPAPLQNAVQTLLGCPCDVAIDSIRNGGTS